MPVAASVDDATLVAAVQAGDIAAFGTLFGRHHDAVLRTCVRRLGNERDGEEVAQAAFVRALERIDQCKGERNFGGWVTTIAVRLAEDHRRSQSRAAPAPQGHGLFDRLISRNGPEEAVLAAEGRRHLRNAIASLPHRQRTVLEARDVEGRSPSQIAAVLGVSVGAVDSVLLRARRSAAGAYRAMALEDGSATLAGVGPGAAASVAGAAAARLGPLDVVRDRLAFMAGRVRAVLSIPSQWGGSGGLREQVAAVVASGAIAVAATTGVGAGAGGATSPAAEDQAAVAGVTAAVPVPVPAVPTVTTLLVPGPAPSPAVPVVPAPAVPAAPAPPEAPAAPPAPVDAPVSAPVAPVSPAVVAEVTGVVTQVVDAAAQEIRDLSARTRLDLR